MAKKAATESAAPMSLRKYAERKGVVIEAVRRAIQSGRLKESVTKDARGFPKISDPELADREWERNTDPSKPWSRTSARNPADVGPSPDTLSYNKARAVREQFAAALAKLEYEEKAGKLVNADEVKIAAFNAARKARDAMLSIPDRLSSVFAGISDEREIHRIMSDELRRVCEELARNMNG